MSIEKPAVTYLSQPTSVSMSDDWYQLATPKHFWIKHRLRVLQAILSKINYINPSPRVADVGCGCGVLQYQLENVFHWKVDGFDLNEAALEHSIAKNHYVAYYDINERRPELKNLYDIIFLFDVIEHLPSDVDFLESVKHHLKPKGVLVVNVPSGPLLFSKYDEVAGHFRRYTMKSLQSALHRSGFKSKLCTYWGLTYIPLLLIRKLLLSVNPSITNAEIIQNGFRPPSKFANRILTALSLVDPVPNLFCGSSLMGIYRLSSNNE
jgi:2-polyprenyl-3-methyl-5-hydroxy-6-metoxy-1,4-benzoquinol methylase